jgi:hypothetical protein
VALPAGRATVRLGLDELEQVTGITLPEPCRHHVSHWKSYQESVVARAIIDAGWYAGEVDLAARIVVLEPEQRLPES